MPVRLLVALAAGLALADASIVTLALPPGRYRATWMNVRTGRTERQESLTGGAARLLESPDYTTDILLSVRRH